jgi:hypothetical protein
MAIVPLNLHGDYMSVWEQRWSRQSYSSSTNALSVAVMMLLTTIAIAGCNGASREILESAAPYPTSIQFDRMRDRLLVSSYGDGSVTEVGMHPSHYFRVLLTPHRNGIQRGIRLKIDAARDRLWLLDTGDIHVYQLETNQFIKKIRLPGLNDPLNNCLPDLALDATGSAIISSNRHYYAMAYRSRHLRSYRARVAEGRGSGQSLWIQQPHVKKKRWQSIRSKCNYGNSLEN